jgi:hypothetical protein
MGWISATYDNTACESFIAALEYELAVRFRFVCPMEPK